MIEALAAMQELPVKVVVPGHGELAGKELLSTQKRYLQELRGTIKAAIEDGRALQQIKVEIDLPFYLEWTGVSVKTRGGNIEHVYRELKGERSQ